MAIAYKGYKAGDVVGTLPGYAPNAWVVPIEWFEEFAEPVISTPTQLPGDTVTIKDSHTFLTGKNPIPIYCAPDSVEGDGETVGDALAQRIKWKPKFIIPGDSAPLLELVKSLLNKSFVLFYKDVECGATKWVQFGCDCTPMTFASGGAFKSGNSGAGRKQYELTAEGFCKYFYLGALPELSSVVII